MAGSLPLTGSGGFKCTLGKGVVAPGWAAERRLAGSGAGGEEQEGPQGGLGWTKPTLGPARPPVLPTPGVQPPLWLRPLPTGRLRALRRAVPQRHQGAQSKLSLPSCCRTDTALAPGPLVPSWTCSHHLYLPRDPAERGTLPRVQAPVPGLPAGDALHCQDHGC